MWYLRCERVYKVARATHTHIAAFSMRRTTIEVIDCLSSASVHIPLQWSDFYSLRFCLEFIINLTCHSHRCALSFHRCFVSQIIWLVSLAWMSSKISLRPEPFFPSLVHVYDSPTKWFDPIRMFKSRFQYNNRMTFTSSSENVSKREISFDWIWIWTRALKSSTSHLNWIGCLFPKQCKSYIYSMCQMIHSQNKSQTFHRKLMHNCRRQNFIWMQLSNSWDSHANTLYVIAQWFCKRWHLSVNLFILMIKQSTRSAVTM